MSKKSNILHIHKKIVLEKFIPVSYLNEHFDKSQRTYQRYMKEVEKVIHDTERVLGIGEEHLSKITYSDEEKGFILKSINNKQDSRELIALMIQLKSITPFISSNVIQYFSSAISKIDKEDQPMLLDYLDQFQIDGEATPEGLLDLQQFIYEGKRISIEYYDDDGEISIKNEIKPLYLIYQFYHHNLVYIENDSIKQIKVVDIIDWQGKPFEQDENNYDDVCTDDSKDLIVTRLRIENGFYEGFKRTFPIIKEVSITDQYAVVDVNIAFEDIFFICCWAAPRVQIIEPNYVIELFNNRVKLINQIHHD